MSTEVNEKAAADVSAAASVAADSDGRREKTPQKKKTRWSKQNKDAARENKPDAEPPSPAPEKKKRGRPAAVKTSKAPLVAAGKKTTRKAVAKSADKTEVAAKKSKPTKSAKTSAASAEERMPASMPSVSAGRPVSAPLAPSVSSSEQDRRPVVLPGETLSGKMFNTTAVSAESGSNVAAIPSSKAGSASASVSAGTNDNTNNNVRTATVLANTAQNAGNPMHDVQPHGKKRRRRKKKNGQNSGNSQSSYSALSSVQTGNTGKLGGNSLDSNKSERLAPPPARYSDIVAVSASEHNALTVPLSAANISAASAAEADGQDKDKVSAAAAIVVSDGQGEPGGQNVSEAQNLSPNHNNGRPNGESSSRKRRRRRHKRKNGQNGQNSGINNNSKDVQSGGMLPVSGEGESRPSAEVSIRQALENLDTVGLYMDTKDLPGRIVLVDPGTASLPAADVSVNDEIRESHPVREKAVRPTGERQTTGRKMLINVVDAGQARVAIVGRDGLEELYIEKDGGRFVHGNIFKGRVDGVQPNLQAAFVNIGGEKNAFLHVNDVIPPFGGYESILGRRRKKAPSDTANMRIEDMLVEGQEVLVQITREALVTKGPSVTTYLSIPGRYLVAMPNSTTRGVSKKITDDNERRELKKALEKLAPPKDMGYIIRTAGMGKGTEELQLDLDALTRMWSTIGEQAKKVKAPTVLYQENDLVIRVIRDNFRDDIDELIIDSADDYTRALDFVNLMMPDFADRIHLYDKREPLFYALGIEEKISNLFNRSVKLKSGGEIILEQTEAMVTIDVNTGKFIKADSTREMILKINLEAAEAIARELRLRDLGGLVMIDFIDMEEAEDRKAVENAMRRLTRSDPSRITILPLSNLGVMEMSRQRLRQSLHHTHYRPCPYCAGAGMYKRPESLGIEFMRRLRSELEKKNITAVKATFNPHTAFDMMNGFRRQLTELENEYNKQVSIVADESFPLDKYVVVGETGK